MLIVLAPNASAGNLLFLRSEISDGRENPENKILKCSTCRSPP
jgi:hypothetical protein